MRRVLPTRRAQITYSVSVGGHKVHMTCGEYEDGSLGEVFIDTFGIGSTDKALVNQFCVMVSLGLQYGIPLKKLVSTFTQVKFAPEGIVSGDDNIKMAQSIIDWVFKRLAHTYLGDASLSHVK